MPQDDFLSFESCCVPAPTTIGEIEASISDRSGRSMDSSKTTEESASPYNAEYPPVLNTVPLKRKGENLPRVDISGTLVKYGLLIRPPSMNCFVSCPVPPRT